MLWNRLSSHDVDSIIHVKSLKKDSDVEEPNANTHSFPCVLKGYILNTIKTSDRFRYLVIFDIHSHRSEILSPCDILDVLGCRALCDNGQWLEVIHYRRKRIHLKYDRAPKSGQEI